MPASVPDLILPTSEKITLDKLRSDIPKFFTSRAFTDDIKKWWQDFLDNQNGLFVVTEKPHVWLLDEIVAIKRRQGAVTEGESQEQQQVLDEEIMAVSGLPQRPSAVPKDIEDMVVEQLTEVPQVENIFTFSVGCWQGRTRKFGIFLSDDANELD